MNAAELDVAARPGETVERAVAATTSKMRNIPSLDGLRAVSVLIVFASHVGFGRVAPGGFGVTIFFFLSGFLITTLLRAEYSRQGAINVRHFLLRRALRILPPCYLALIFSLAATVLLFPTESVSGAATLARALHYTNYWTIYRDHAGEPVGTGLYWSLAVEEHFYLLFPWLYIGLQRLRFPAFRQALVFWGLCAAILVWRFVLVLAFDVSENRIYLGSDTRIDSILFGCALAVWGNPVMDRTTIAPGSWKWGILPCALVALVVSQLVTDPVFRDTLRYTVQGIALAFVFIAAIRFHEWGPFRILNWPPLAFIGVLSYSLYLIHHTIILSIAHVLPGISPAAGAALSLATSVALACAIYLCIEVPLGRMRKRFQD